MADHEKAVLRTIESPDFTAKTILGLAASASSVAAWGQSAGCVLVVEFAGEKDRVVTASGRPTIQATP